MTTPGIEPTTSGSLCDAVPTEPCGLLGWSFTLAIYTYKY